MVDVKKTTAGWLDLLTGPATAITAEACAAGLLPVLGELLDYDAAAILRLEAGSTLRPLAVSGLAEDTLGRRFRVDEHPRLSSILNLGAPIRFAADSGLPDPYDGLVEDHDGELDVHDCMGVILGSAPDPWGLVTVDALTAGRFTQAEQAVLGQFAQVATALLARFDVAGPGIPGETDGKRPQLVTLREDAQDMVGRSPAMQQLQQEIDTVAASDLTVLVQGETGVGKELVARALHRQSPRGAAPLVEVNCAALPDALVESELFGHVRGAFTGAVSDRRGKFELADGGTLLLDEIGELPLAAQAKLLRVLQTGELQRLGSDASHHVDVRVIAATNRDLARMVSDNRFRADLYHRLSVYPISVPPLRERGADILRLAGFFLERTRATLGLRNLRLSPAPGTSYWRMTGRVMSVSWSM